jgi:hypothetical protein
MLRLYACGQSAVSVWQQFHFPWPDFFGLVVRVKLPEKLNLVLRARPLTRTRILLAITVAIVADGLQFFLGPLGWVLVDQVIDLVAMILTVWLLGFHVLLLPTFLVELVPLIDQLPTWTACVAAVIALRKRAENVAATPPIIKPPTQPPIDV